MKPLTSRSQSCGTFRRMAALPPISDQTKGITKSQLGTERNVSRSIPNVKIVTGHGVTPNIGISG